MSILDTIVTINPFAVLVAGIVHMVTGLIWYQPGIFGKPWMELTGKDLKPASQWMILGLIGHFAIALVLAIIVYLANATTAISGVSCRRTGLGGIHRDPGNRRTDLGKDFLQAVSHPD